MQRHRYDRVNFSARSRPLDNREAVSKKFFSALRASVWSDKKGVPGHWAPPLDPPLNLTKKRLKRCLFTLSVQAQYSSTMLAESTRAYLSVNTPALCIQARIQVRWRCEYKVDHVQQQQYDFRLAGCQLNCMHAYIVSLEVRICLLTVHFFFLTQNGAIASIMNNIRYKVLEAAPFCDFCAGSLAIMFGHCTKCKTSLSVCYY